MGDIKLKISDLFKYILLGAFQVLLCGLLLKVDNIFDYLNLSKYLPDNALLSLIMILSVFYILGFITQMIIQLFCKNNLMGTGLGEIGVFIRNFPSNFLNHNRYPHWLYYSDKPDKVLSIYREIMETNRDSDTKTEYLYANNLFQGLSLTLVVLSIIGLPGLLWHVKIINSILVVILLCMLGFNSTKFKLILIINKLCIVLIPLLIFIVYLVSCINLNVEHKSSCLFQGSAFALSLLICLCMAEQLGRRHIIRLDTLIKYANTGENEMKFIKTLKRNGVPAAYILTRVDDSTEEYFGQQLESIKQQVYPRIKVLILIDSSAVKRDLIIRKIEDIQNQGVDIRYYISKSSGAAWLAYEIKEIFLNYADDNDVAISLDSDDKFASPHVVTRIIGRMARTKANICLLTFEVFGDILLNYSKNNPNKIVRRIAVDTTEKGKALTPSQLIERGDAHLISTIGWVKCYKPSVIKKYLALWEPYNQTLKEYTKYEDFPDIVALLDKESRICAVGRTSILFRKHAGSVTTTVSSENYRKHIVHYLYMARVLSKNNPGLTEEVKELINCKFIPFKFLQYLNIVYLKTIGTNPEIPDYSPNCFYKDFTDKVYPNDRGLLKEGIVAILKANYKIISRDQNTGYYGEDLPGSLRIPDARFEDVREIFRIDEDADEEPKYCGKRDA